MILLYLVLQSITYCSLQLAQGGGIFKGQNQIGLYRACWPLWGTLLLWEWPAPYGRGGWQNRWAARWAHHPLGRASAAVVEVEVEGCPPRSHCCCRHWVSSADPVLLWVWCWPLPGRRCVFPAPEASHLSSASAAGAPPTLVLAGQPPSRMFLEW